MRLDADPCQRATASNWPMGSVPLMSRVEIKSRAPVGQEPWLASIGAGCWGQRCDANGEGATSPIPSPASWPSCGFQIRQLGFSAKERGRAGRPGAADSAIPVTVLC